MTGERFVKIVEDDLQRIGQWVTLQSESLSIKLGIIRNNCTDKSYSVDYLRGAAQQRARAGAPAAAARGRACSSSARADARTPALPAASRAQSKRTTWGA
jgi:hypothetical protein